MLEIKNLYKKYGNFHALDGLDMEVSEGELFGFVGPNGAGKTTTLRILAGLLRADGGSVYIRGVDALKKRGKIKEYIGYVPDFFGVYDNLKVREYMDFYAGTYGLDGLRARNRCMELLEMVGLSEKVDEYVDGLSRGMKQRLCVARALVHNPDILILDEPASGLDPRTRLQFKETLKELNTVGKTIIISSHILSEISEMCTDIGIIDKGKMVLRGTMVDIMAAVNSANPLEISIDGPIEKAKEILKRNSCVKTIAIEGQNFVVTFRGSIRQETELLRSLILAEVRVKSFSRMTGSLESLFMELTEQTTEKVVSTNEE